MNTIYETERLFLKLLTPSALREVLDFQLRNRNLFERYEPLHPENFYTLSYQQSILKCEQKLALQLSTVRFYIFCKDNPDYIIGTVCLHEIKRSPYFCCEIGYKFDQNYHHCGYAKEALSKAIEIIFYELELHRIIAHVMPENTASIRLLESLNFRNEGTEYRSAQIRGVWQDHIRFALLSPIESSPFTPL